MDLRSEVIITFSLTENTSMTHSESKVKGFFDLSIDPRIKNMSFTDRGLFAMVEVKDAPEFSLRLIRVNYK